MSYTSIVRNIKVILLAIVLLAILIPALIYFYKTRISVKKGSGAKITTTVKKAQGETRFFGALRSYEITDDLWSESMGIEKTGFVLEQIRTESPIEIETMIPIENALGLDLASLANKCVEIQGNIKSNNNIDGYGKTIIEIKNIEISSYGNCKEYPSQEYAEDLKRETISGHLERITRNYPDITYDYILKLNKPYIDKYSASGIDTPVYEILITPKDNGIWEQFESMINQEVEIQGFWSWGFAESRYIVVENIVTVSTIVGSRSN